MGKAILIIKLKVLLKQISFPKGNKILFDQRSKMAKKYKENAIILLGLSFDKLILFNIN